MSPDYGGDHRALRRALLPYAYGQPCPRCGRPMLEGQLLELDHADDGPGYNGIAHRLCNARAGGRKGQRRRRQRRRTKMLEIDWQAYGVAISRDRQHTAIAAAGRVDDVIVVDLARYLEGVSRAATAILELCGRRTVAIDPNAPAATLLRPLKEAGIEAAEPSPSDLVIAHGRFRDLLEERRLKHTGASELTSAIQYGSERNMRGATAWKRDGDVDMAPAEAAELAVWALLDGPVYPPPDIF